MEESKSSQQSPNISRESQPHQLDINSIVTIILLVFAFPLGVLLMWFLTRWPKWVKITLTAVLVFMFLLTAVVLAFSWAVFFNLSNELKQKEQNALQKRIAVEKEIEEEKQKIMIGDAKTYTNKTYQFILTYPSTVKVLSNGDFAADFVDIETDTKMVIPSDIKVRVETTSDVSNFEKMYEAPNNFIFSDEQHAAGAKFTKLKNYQVDGYKVVSYQYTVPGNQTEQSTTQGIIVNKNGTFIKIYASASNVAILEQIASTLTFTK